MSIGLEYQWGTFSEKLTEYCECSCFRCLKELSVKFCSETKHCTSSAASSVAESHLTSRGVPFWHFHGGFLVNHKVTISAGNVIVNIELWLFDATVPKFREVKAWPIHLVDKEQENITLVMSLSTADVMMPLVLYTPVSAFPKILYYITTLYNGLT